MSGTTAKKGRSPKPEIATVADEVSLDLVLPSNAIRTEELADHLRKLKGVHLSVRSDNGGVRGVCALAASVKSHHMHFSVERSSAEGSLALQLSILPGVHDKKVAMPSFDKVLIALRAAMTESDAEFRGLLSANYAFDMKEWQPSFPLPIDGSGPLAASSGKARICGLDFVFEGDDSALSLVRGFVTTYEASEQIVVRLLYRFRGILNETLPYVMASSADFALSVLASKKQ